ncbi:DUF4397 domain-containing protein [Streptomyces sp. NPDC088197]|uniref:DUF4397 domain-containing protein n=1 Tax=unclassified Streptomyces TaxID=2593676 RepID=UPI00381879F4
MRLFPRATARTGSSSRPSSRSSARAAALGAAAVLTLSAAVLAGPAAAGASAAPAWSGGWLRLAHFSPGTPPVDVYLYPFGGSKAAMVLKSVSYGHASPYESVATGQYTVAMRKAGDPASVSPVISSTVRVVQGRAYTVAGLGPNSALQLRTLSDQLSAPQGQAAVRVIQASLSQPAVAVHVAALNQGSLRFPASTPYRTVSAGSTTVRVSAGAATTSRTVQLTGRSTHTLVVLSSTGSAPGLLDLTDSAGPSRQPHGGVDAGFGGLDQRKAAAEGSRTPQLVGWGAALVIGSGLLVLSVRRLRRG